MNDAGDTQPSRRRYHAPALEKGLDIIELVARSKQPLTVAMMARKLAKSMSELFRMIQVLEYRGFIQQAPGGGYVATNHLFLLGMEQAPVKTMLEIALPVMRDLASALGQSCHVAVRSGGDIVVIARMESGRNIGFSVRVGHKNALAVTASGAILFAFQQESVRASWLPQIADDSQSEAISQLQARANLIRDRGYERMSSKSVRGLTDISAPILRGAVAAAALTVPFVHFIELSVPINEAIEHLMTAAATISASLLLADRRV